MARLDEGDDEDAAGNSVNVYFGFYFSGFLKDFFGGDGIVEHLGENLRNHAVAGGEEIATFSLGEISGEFLGSGIFREDAEDIGRKNVVDIGGIFRGNGGEKADGKDEDDDKDIGEGEEKPAGGGVGDEEEIESAEKGED